MITDHSRIQSPRPKAKVPTVLEFIGGVIALPTIDWTRSFSRACMWVVIYIKPAWCR
jgi:hypothetical protein